MLCFCVCVVCVHTWTVSGGHAVELQQPGSGQRCIYHRELWIWLHTCRHGCPLHQGPVQRYIHTNTEVWKWPTALLLPLMSYALVVCVCSGTLTAVESFLTVQAGPDVSNLTTHTFMQWASDHLFSSSMIFVHSAPFCVHVRVCPSPSTIRVAVSMMAPGSRLSMLSRTVKLCRVSGGSSITNPFLLLAPSWKAGTYSYISY